MSHLRAQFTQVRERVRRQNEVVPVVTRRELARERAEAPARLCAAGAVEVVGAHLRPVAFAQMCVVARGDVCVAELPRREPEPRGQLLPLDAGRERSVLVGERAPQQRAFFGVGRGQRDAEQQVLAERPRGLPLIRRRDEGQPREIFDGVGERTTVRGEFFVVFGQQVEVFEEKRGRLEEGFAHDDAQVLLEIVPAAEQSPQVNGEQPCAEFVAERRRQRLLPRPVGAMKVEDELAPRGQGAAQVLPRQVEQPVFQLVVPAQFRKRESGGRGAHRSLGLMLHPADAEQVVGHALIEAHGACELRRCGVFRIAQDVRAKECRPPREEGACAQALAGRGREQPQEQVYARSFAREVVLKKRVELFVFEVCFEREAGGDGARLERGQPEQAREVRQREEVAALKRGLRTRIYFEPERGRGRL